MYMNLFDSHVHSDNSHDGEHSVTFLCENAQEKGLMGLCITDHYELNLNNAQADMCLRNSFIETGRARQAFDHRLMVMNGIEMGQAIQDLNRANAVLRKYRFDFVIGSLHCDRQMDDYAYVDFSNLLFRSQRLARLPDPPLPARIWRWKSTQPDCGAKSGRPPQRWNMSGSSANWADGS